jgi:hypothetical protein
MKKNEKKSLLKIRQQNIKCLACGLCHSAHHGEKGACPDTRNDVKALYNAEVMNYDFYFARLAGHSN